MIQSDQPLPVTRRCELLKVARSTAYCRPGPVSHEDLVLMRLIDEIYLELPFYGSRRIRDELETRGHPAATSTLDYSGVCRPARGVGGDYYDFLPVGEHRLGLAVADVSGKGMFAGLLMASLQGQVQSLALRHGVALDTLVGELNRLMYASTASDKYVTLFYGVYDDRTRELTYVNAGHVPPLLFRPRNPATAVGYDVRSLRPSGMVIGLMAEETFPQESVQLAPGDVLLIVTDGMTEAVDDNDEEFGRARLEALVTQHGRRSASELRDVILRDVDRFRGDSAQQDDTTLVVAKVL